jgi:hypothetical protein
MTIKLSGITGNNVGAALGSCDCFLFKYDSSAHTLVQKDYVTSNSSTGAYTFTGVADTAAAYMVTSFKNGTPNVFDMTDHNLQPIDDAAISFTQKLWLDSTDNASLTINSGRVTTWGDKSGDGNNFVQVATTFAPTIGGTINGQQSTSFISTDNTYMTCGGITVAQPFTVFAVQQMLAGPDYSFIIDGTNSGNRASLLSAPATPNFFYQINGLTGVTPLNSSAHVVAAYYNGANSAIYYNSTTPEITGMTTATNISGLTLGSRYSLDEGFLNSYLGELRIYQGIPGTNDIANMITTLKSKWGIA